MLPIKNLRDMYESEGFQYFDSDLRSNQMLLDDPDRAERIYDAAENGSEGSTHREIIQDWRDYLNLLKTFDPEYDDIEDIEKYDITLKTSNTIEKEINDCEQWHIDHKTIDNQIG
jgi:hypothetical protein